MPVGVIDGDVKADDVGDEWRDGGVPSKPMAWLMALGMGARWGWGAGGDERGAWEGAEVVVAVAVVAGRVGGGGGAPSYPIHCFLVSRLSASMLHRWPPLRHTMSNMTPLAGRAYMASAAPRGRGGRGVGRGAWGEGRGVATWPWQRHGAMVPWCHGGPMDRLRMTSCLPSAKARICEPSVSARTCRVAPSSE